MKADEFCTINDNINGGSREFIINTELRDTLDNLEAGYQDHYHLIPAFNKTTREENVAHASKKETNQLVEKNYFSYGSSEYYAVWFYNYSSTLNLINQLQLYMETYTAIYSTYLSMVSFYYSYLLYTNDAFVYLNSGQYQSSASYLDDIDDAITGLSYTDKSIVTADERNAVWAARGYDQPPYLEDTPVVKIKLTEETKFSRVYSSNSPNGSWIMRPSDIEGLSASQIQAKYSLSSTPTQICDVTIPAGTEIYVGITKPNFNQPGLGVQFDLDWQNIAEWFSNFRLLP